MKKCLGFVHQKTRRKTYMVASCVGKHSYVTKQEIVTYFRHEFLSHDGNEWTRATHSTLDASQNDIRI